MALLEVENLCSGYGDLEVLHSISLAVNKGEFVGMFGANGAGKTTFLRTLSGILKVKSGRILFESVDLTRMPSYRVPSLRIAHVPEGRQIFPKLTVHDNLLMGSYLIKDKQFRSRQMEFVFNLFPKLKERERQMAGTMSGGEQQMVAVGRALMLDPKLLMLDEPSQGLSPKVATEMYEKLGEIHAGGTSILLVEQSVAAALKYTSRAYVFERGRITLEGTSAELQDNDEVRRTYLGV
jgi:branched-chain amino acid transport system ATP-binding protein